MKKKLMKKCKDIFCPIDIKNLIDDAQMRGFKEGIEKCREIVDKVQADNPESNGRYNACLEIIKSLSELEEK